MIALINQLFGFADPFFFMMYDQSSVCEIQNERMNNSSVPRKPAKERNG